MTQLTGHSQARRAITALLQLIGAALLLFFALSTPAFAEDAPLEISGAKTVDLKEYRRSPFDNAGLVVIDNRKQPDFDRGYIEGVVNIPDTNMSKELLPNAGSFHQHGHPFYCNGVKMPAQCFIAGWLGVIDAARSTISAKAAPRLTAVIENLPRRKPRRSGEEEARGAST